MLTIISGGQTGVDQTALRVARGMSFPTGGTAPKGWRTDEGPAPWLATFGLVESFSAQYNPRTIKNVRDADQTVWFGVTTSPGGVLTIGTARAQGKPILINPNADSLYQLLHTSYPVRVLNVAGNRLRTHPESASRAHQVLADVLTMLLVDQRVP